MPADRTHDRDLYLRESRYEEPKEIFKFLVRLMRESGVPADGAAVGDIGCAAGEFLYYLAREFPHARLTGYDVVPELLEKARIHVPEAEFRLGSVLDANLVREGSLDVALLVGVHSIFDEVETCFSNVLRWTRRGGRALVFGFFNPAPVDVWIRYRLAEGADPEHREPGWNIFSKAMVSRFLDSRVGPGAYRFVPFEMPFDLEPNAEDPVRTWTFRDASGRRLLTNGLSLIVNLEALEIRP